MTYMASHGSTPYKDSKLSPKKRYQESEAGGSSVGYVGFKFQ